MGPRCKGNGGKGTKSSKTNSLIPVEAEGPTQNRQPKKKNQRSKEQTSLTQKATEKKRKRTCTREQQRQSGKEDNGAGFKYTGKQDSNR